jgi:methylated-DNA-[protein]-cysteine S-methyltransferase
MMSEIFTWALSEEIEEPGAFCLVAPFAELAVYLSGDAVSSIEIDTTLGQYDINTTPRGAFAQRVYAQLQAYFADASSPLDIAVRYSEYSTAFQRKVWRALQKIPRGQVVTYGELAAQLGTNPRAVGNACGANPLPIIIPCHRVVAKNGLGGYMGKKGLNYKRWLLQHEGVEV